MKTRTRPEHNVIARALVIGALGAGALASWAGFVGAQTSSWTTRTDVPVAQPVPFSHAHHVGGLGLGCRYCHPGADSASAAGVPGPDTCMHCHGKLYTRAALLAPVREAWEAGAPMTWQRVHDLPDFVFFDHAIHARAGVDCFECHGDVGRMPLAAKAEPLTMSWCLDCQRHPTSVTTLDPTRRATTSLTDCSMCHR